MNRILLVFWNRNKRKCLVEASLLLTSFQQELQSSTALKLHLLATRTHPHGLHHQAEHVLVLLQHQQKDHVYD